MAFTNRVLRPAVVKVGGSLFDLPDLGRRLAAWLETFRGEPVLLVPGGGPAADVVRGLDRVHGLGEECSHWLALHALTLNAHFLAAVLPSAHVVTQPAECSECWRRGLYPVLDAFDFVRADEGSPGCLLHSWDVTSDSVAARVAMVSGAARLILLKSTDLPAGIGWPEAAGLGVVDPCFATLAPGLPKVEVVNLRKWPEIQPAC